MTGFIVRRVLSSILVVVLTSMWTESNVKPVDGPRHV